MKHLSLCILLILTILSFHRAYTQEDSSNFLEENFSKVENFISTGKYDEAINTLEEIESLDKEKSLLDDVSKLNIAYLKALISQKTGNNYKLQKKDSFLLYRPAQRLEIPPLLQAKILNLQGIYFTSYPTRNLDSSIYYFAAAKEILEKEKDTSSLIFRARLLENIGNAYFDKGEWINALQLIEESFEIRKELFDSLDLELAKSYSSYALILGKMGNSRKSEALFEKALKICEQNGRGESRETVSLYLHLANAYQQGGDYLRAKLFYEKALAVNLKYEASNSWLSTDIKKQIVQLLLQSGQEKAGLEEMDKVLATVKVGEDFELSDMALLYVNFAIELYEIDKLSEAKKMLDQALEIFENDELAYLPNYVLGISYSVRLLIDAKNWQEAEEVNDFYREMSAQAYGEGHWDMCYYHYFQGKILMGRNKYEAARKELRKCIEILESEDFISVVQSNDALTLADAYILISKSYLAQHELIPNEEFLTEARENVARANNIVLKLKESKLSIDEKMAVRKFIPYVMETILKLEYSSSKPDLAYTLNQLDQGKNQILKESLTGLEDLRLADVPTDVIAKWSELKDSVDFLERQWQAEMAPEYKSLLQKRYLIATRNLEKYYASISKEYPQIHQINRIKSDIELTTIKEKLQPKEGMIQYFWGKEKIFIYYMDERREKFHSVVKDEKLELAVEDFRKAVSTPGSAMKTFLTTAYTLYEVLIEPIGELPEKLIIIPDGILSYLPFEAFLTESRTASTDYRKLPYLIRDCSISYNYSLGLLSIMQNRQKRAGKLLAFAPYFKGETYKRGSETLQFGPLSNASTEVKAVSKYFSGDYYQGTYATKSNLLDNIHENTILHLATHALVDENDHKSSFLAFSGEESGENQLYLDDLYAMQWPLELVVLSSCETAQGKHLKGEGIAGLTRAFAFAGAGSMVTTLWSSNDKSGEQIMVNFYENLSAGRQKDVALQQAKIKYLNEILDIGKAHPAYWSNFILYGDTAAIERSQTWTFIFMGLVLAMLVAVVVALRRFK